MCNIYIALAVGLIYFSLYENSYGIRQTPYYCFKWQGELEACQ